MAWSTSKVFVAFIHDALEGTSAWALATDAPKVALYGVGLTPDATVAIASSAYNTGQWVTGGEITDSGGWPSGGRTLLNPLSTIASNVYTYDGDNTVSADSHTTLTDVYGCLVYDDTISTPVADAGLSFHYFGAAQSVGEGTFTVAWNASGLFTFTV